MAEWTFVMVKPDGVGRRLIGKIIARYEARGLKLVGLKMQLLTDRKSTRLNSSHIQKSRMPSSA